MAETEVEALEQQREIENWEDSPKVSASLAGDQKLFGWEDNCLVYHAGREDVRLGRARDICKESEQQPA